MPETTSAQPLTLFQSPVMVALERLLSQLTSRIAGPQSQFGSRNLSFVERILSRRLDSLGFAPTADMALPERAVAPQSWVLPRSWVPSPAELLRLGQPASPVARPAGAPASPLAVTAQGRRPVVAPLPSPAARQEVGAPAMPLPIPDELPQPAAQTAARPAAARPVVAAAAPSAPAVPAASTAQPVPTAQAAPAAPAAPQVSAGVPASLPTAPSLSHDEPAETAAPAVSPPVAAAAPAEPTLASPPAAPSSPAAAAPERRVRDWLAQWSSPVAAPAAPAFAAALASPSYPAAPSALARAFSHLGWADTQLVRSPSQRLAAAAQPSPLVETEARPLPALAMPMVSTPDLVAPARRPPTAAPFALPSRPVEPAAEARRVVAAPLSVAAEPTRAAASPAPSEQPRLSTPALAQLVAPLASPISLPSTQPAALAASPASLHPAQNLALDLGLLAQPLLAALSSAQAGVGAPLAPAQAGAWLPPAWSEPGALASRFEGFAAAHHGVTAAAAPASGPSGVHAWASAPGVPAALSRALHREESYTPVRWQRAEAALPFLPAPSVEPTPQAAPGATAAPRPAPVSVSAPALRAPILSSAPAPTFQAPQPQPSAVEAAQPWRAIGGAATLAEMFAAGIGLSSGAIATLAQTTGAAPGGLIADWLQPLLRAEPATIGQAAPSLGGRLLDLVARAERQAADGVSSPSPLAVQAAGRRPLTAIGERALSPLSLAAEPAPAASGRWMPTASGLVWVAPERPSQARPEGRAPSPFASAAAPIAAAWSQAGALGLRTEQLAASQGVRVAGASQASPSARQEWAAAPGISDTISRALGGEESQLPARWQQLGSQLPFLSLPSAPPTPQGERPATAAPRPATARPAATATVAAEARRPWLDLGGTAALAELFAAGVGLGSGSAGLLAEAAPERKPGLVPSWLRSLLSAPEPGTAPTERQTPFASTMLPYLGIDAAPARGQAAFMAQQAGLSAMGERSVERAPSPGLARTFLRAGGLSVGAEQFAASHGLGSAAGLISQGEAGQWVPIAGGMVFVPREEAPRGAEASPGTAAERPRPPAMPSLSPLSPLSQPGDAWSRAGGMGLRTELFASQQVASKQPGGMVHQLALPEQLRGGVPSEAASAPRWGWSGAGGLFFLGPTPEGNAASGEAADREGGPWRPSLFGQDREMVASGLAASQPRAQRQPLGLSWVPPSVASAMQAPQVHEAHDDEQQQAEAEPQPSRRAWTGGLPVLSLPPEGVARSAGEQAAGSAATQELGARFAAPMLTSFPRQAAAEQQPLSLWPQTTLATTERLTRVLAMLPTGWQPTPAVVSAMAEAGAAGMPLWQQIPMAAPISVLPSADPTDEDDAEEPVQSRANMPVVSALPGSAPSRQQQQQRPAAVAPPPPQPPARRAPDAEMITAALTASGASKAQVEASVKLMQAIRSHASSSVAKSDERLSLDDLHMIAISMGEGRMAASQTSISNAAGSVEAAVRLAPPQHPNTPDDDKMVTKKVGHMAEMVVKLIKSLTDSQSVRNGGS